MKTFEYIINETPAINATMDTLAKQIKKALMNGLKKINKKEIKGDFPTLKKLNVLQVALNSIEDNF